MYAYGDEDYTVTYWYDANNRLLESEKDDGYTETVTEYSYDDNGNQVEKEVWIDNSFDSSETSVYNGFNQLVSVSNDNVDAEYTYAPSGLRLTKTVDNEQIYYINDGDNVIAELYDDEVTAYYLRGLNLYGSFIGNDEYFYLYNAHGDVVNLTDTSGYIEHTYRYDAFGNEREPESSDNNPFRYCGEYYDGETGSYYLRARYYDPVVGRFSQEDPHWNVKNRIYGDKLVPFDKIVHPSGYRCTPRIVVIHQSGNLYVYGVNNTICYIDSNGEWVHIAIGAVAGAVVSTVVSVGTQYATNKSVSIASTMIAAGGGAISGALAASGVGIVGQILGNGIISGATNVASQITDNSSTGIDPYAVAANIGLGMLAGKIGGAGANANNYLQSLSKQLTNRVGNAFLHKSGQSLTKELTNAFGYYIRSSGTTNKDLMTGIIKSNIPAAAVGGVEMLNELIKSVEALF